MKAACRYFRKCSGCTKLQFPYVKQLRDKDLVIRDALARFVPDNASGVFLPLEASPAPLGYRTSAKLSLQMDGFGRRSVGLYERNSKVVVDIPGCPVHQPALETLVQRLFGATSGMALPYYDHAKRGFQAGRLKFATLRVSPATGEAGLVLSHTGVDRAALESWAKSINTRQLSVYEAVLTAADDDRILSETVRHLAGPTHFRYAVGGQTYKLTPLAFFQANASLSDAFIAHIAGDLSGRTLLDLYGGFGPYSFTAGKHFSKTYLVDGSAGAIAAAAETNKTIGVAGLTPVHASVEDFLGRRLPKGERASVTHVIVNPPRGGLSAKVKSMLTAEVFPGLTGLTYVSCNLETLAPDLGELTRSTGLRVASIRGFDMFPQTDHIEVVVKLA